MVNFLKGIVVGIGGIAPGLSGSVLLIIFGLYQKTLDALASLLRDFRRQVRFLLPLLLGMGCGVLLFSRVIDFCLTCYEMPTRFCFLGLIVGTIPLFYQEVRKEGFSGRYYLVIALAAALGLWMFAVNPESFAQVTDPTALQSIFLGVAVAATAIVPGLDPAVVLSSIGYYELYVRSLAELDLGVLLPMLLGVAAGGIGISKLMSILFRRFYTAAFSAVFGLFLSMIPNMLNDSCTLRLDAVSLVSCVVMVAGCLVSYFLGNLENNSSRLNALLTGKKNKGV